jgi:hypothetical protein
MSSAAAPTTGTCWNCEIYEDYRWNWMTEEWQFVDVGTCNPFYPEGYAGVCWEAPNEFEWPSGEYNGGWCDLGAAGENCDCSELPPFTCYVSVPASDVSADGLLTRTEVTTAAEFDIKRPAQTCTGILLEHFVTPSAAAAAREARRRFVA